MASESTARPSPHASKPSKVSGTHLRDRQPLPTPREAAPTAAEPALRAEDEVDFEAHDTIPAPPWLDDDGPAHEG